METVKVDIQKLQLLNDRISQTIEALNHVRMSVQGIQHSTQAQQVSPYGFTPTFGSYGSMPFGAQPMFQPTWNTAFTPYGGSPYPQVTPYGAMPFMPQQQSFGVQHTTPTAPTMVTPWTNQWSGTGISHSTWDPTWQMRAQQAWPFVYPTW